MADTHINSFITEVEDAYKEASAALARFYETVQALKTKYASHVAEVAAAVGQSVPEVEALIPAAKPEIDQAEAAVDTAEEDAKALEAELPKGDTSKPKS